MTAWVGRIVAALIGACVLALLAALTLVVGAANAATGPDVVAAVLAASALGLLAYATASLIRVPTHDGTTTRPVRTHDREVAPPLAPRTDGLTGLADRAAFRDRLDHALITAERAGQNLAVMFIDLDGFKEINDRYGHHTGDAVLQQVATRLQENARRADTVARLGGDEFTILLEALDEPEGAGTVADKLIDALTAPYTTDAGEVDVSASIGIATYPGDAADAATLLRHADAAMYAAKATAPGSYRFSTVDLRESTARRRYLVERIGTALDEGTLQLVYQPQVSLDTGQVVAVEALARWSDDGDLIPAAAWLPIIEHTHLAEPLATWVIETACQRLSSWLRVGLDLAITINVSARQFRSPHLVQDLRRSLEHTGTPAERIEIEITEEALTGDAVAAAATIRELRALGVRIAIDHYGTGLTSIRYLRSLPIETLKIDPSFLEAEGPDGDTLAGAITGLARHFTIDTVAGGVETAAQWDAAKRIRAGRVQGFHVAGPLPGDDVEPFIRRRAISTAAAR